MRLRVLGTAVVGVLCAVPLLDACTSTATSPGEEPAPDGGAGSGGDGDGGDGARTMASGGVAGTGGNRAGSGGTSGETGESGAGGVPSGGDPAGGAAGGGTIGDDRPEVVAIDPPDDARDVDVTLGSVTIEFDEPLDPSTVSERTFSIREGDATLDVDVSYEGTTVTLTLGEPLKLLQTYTVEVGADVTDENGTPMGAPFSAKFTVRDGAWTEPEPVEENPASLVGMYGPSVAVDDAGNMLVVYQLQGESFSMRAPVARWYRRGSGWEAPVPLDPTQGANCDSIRVAVNGRGDDAVAVWQCGEQVWLRDYLDGVWDKGTIALDGTPNGPIVPLVVSDDAFIAYANEDRTRLMVAQRTDDYTRELSPGPESGHRVDSAPFLAADAAGNAFVFWAARSASNVRSISYARHAAGTQGWTGTATVPGSAAPDGVAAPQFALDDAGNGMAIWVVHHVPGVSDLMASYFKKGEGWGPAKPVDNLDAEIGGMQPKIVFDGSDFIVAYRQFVTGAWNMYRARYTGGSWTEPELASDGAMSAREPHLASDRRGNTILAWTTAPTNPSGGGTARGTLIIHRYSSVERRWIDVTPAPPVPSYGFNMELAASRSGVAALVWAGLDSTVYRGSPTDYADALLMRFE